MCGILGVAEPGSPTLEVSRSGLPEGLAALRHRGPDAQGIRELRGPGSSAVFGHTRLRIIDLSSEADQPMSNEDDTVWVTFNGEIYNFAELREELVVAGHTFRSRSDTEVLVHLYEAVDGDVERMLARLRGMFAFALFDRSRERLVLCRDRLGIKPLYWARHGDGLAFASETRALVRAGVIQPGPDSEALIGYLLWGSVQGPRTVFSGVREVPAGGWLDWNGGAPTVREWWRPVFAPEPVERPEAVQAIRTALTDSIARHLVADREVGVFLSGGVDSGAVASIASELGSLRSLTVTFPDTGEDEGSAAARVAAELGMTHEVVPVTGADLGEWLPSIVGAMDQPTSDGVNSWLVSRAARQAGLVVALSGVGGDELFGGYPTFRLVPQVLAASKTLGVLPDSIRGRIGGLASAGPGGRLSRMASAEADVGGAYLAVRALFGAGDLSRFGAAGWLARDPANAIRRFKPEADGARDMGDAIAELELSRYLRNQLLRDADQMSMAHSLEVRVPLLDDRVVETALRIPSAIRNRPGKQLLRSGAGLSTGGEKLTFTLPFHRWMRGPLREVVREGLLSDALPLSWLVSAEARRTLWDGFAAGRVHWSRPWGVAVLRWWAEVNGHRW